MNKYLLAALVPSLLAVCSVRAGAQIDTASVYKDRQDTLKATVFSASMPGNFLSKTKDLRVETISAAGLCKMACCNLAESFENSASVSVGYSDAVTGARQIRLLGQSGIYTQMLDENRPVMRGLSAPFGLSYVPSQWLESIQIAKGVTSVINGVESMTGQINMEHRKTTEERPLYLQASIMNDTKADLNVVSALQLDEEQKWTTVLFGHADGNFKTMDHNGDGFMDDPRNLMLSAGNRWLYYDYNTGAQLRFGVSAIRDKRTGGQVASDGWRSDIENKSFDAYVKFGIPVNEEQTGSVAVILDYTRQWMDSSFGNVPFTGRQGSFFVNALYQNDINESNKFTVGLSDTFDKIDQSLGGSPSPISINDFGAFGEYTYHAGDAFSAILGLRADCYSLQKARFSPRLTLRWAPVKSLVFRANGGRGIRYSNPLVDNFGVFSTTKDFTGNYADAIFEDSWTFGGNVTWYLPFDKSEKTYLSLDYFRTQFTEQMLIDNTATGIFFYALSSLKDGRSRTDNFQVDFSTEPVRGLTVTLTGRFTDPRQTLQYQKDDVKPMTSLYKGVLNVQYATNLNKWIFDFTASINGPCKVWDFMRDRYPDGRTPAYPLLYAQVTRRLKGIDIYLGGENLTNFTQKDPIIGVDHPFAKGFDASCVWGPLMGVKLYAGIRLSIWKTD